MASEKEHPSSKAAPRPGSPEDVVDAFVVTDAEDVTEHVTDTENGKKISLGWKVALALVTFIAGLFSAPYAWPLLQTLGLAEHGPTLTNQAQKSLMLPMNALQDDATKALDQDIRNLRQILARQSERLQALEAFSQTFPGPESRLEPNTEASTRTDKDTPQSGALETGVFKNAGLSSSEQADQEARDKRLSDRIDRFDKDLQSLTRTLVNLQSSTRLTASETSENNVSQAEMVDLRTALDLVQSEVDRLGNRLQATNSQMKALESGSLAATPRGRIFLALDDFDHKIASSQPFGGVITVLRPDLKALPTIDQQAVSPHIQTLERLAGGVKSEQSLRDIFTAMLPELITHMEQKQTGFLGSLVTVRRTDDKAEGFDRAIKQAEEAVRANDFKAAQKAIAPYLSDNETPAANDWMTHAKNHSAAKEALEALRRALLSETGP